MGLCKCGSAALSQLCCKAAVVTMRSLAPGLAALSQVGVKQGLGRSGICISCTTDMIRYTLCCFIAAPHQGCLLGQTPISGRGRRLE